MTLLVEFGLASVGFDLVGIVVRTSWVVGFT